VNYKKAMDQMDAARARYAAQHEAAVSLEDRLLKKHGAKDLKELEKKVLELNDRIKKLEAIIEEKWNDVKDNFDS
jgi:hypothetical protein